MRNTNQMTIHPTLDKTNCGLFSKAIYFPMDPTKRSEAVKWGRDSFRCSLERGCDLDTYDEICAEFKNYYEPKQYDRNLEILLELYYRYEYARMQCYCIIYESEGYSAATQKKWQKRLTGVIDEFMRLVEELDCPAFNHFKRYSMDTNMNEFYYAINDLTNDFN